MAINEAMFNALQPGVNQLNTSSAEAKLKKYLQTQEKGAVDAEGNYTPGTNYLSEQKMQKGNVKLAQDVFDANKGSGGGTVNVSDHGVSIGAKELNPAAGLAKRESNEKEYAKRLEKYSDLHGALNDLEMITNGDGQGGVFTNPNATLKSSGKVISALPDSALGLAELTKMAPAGTAEERKAIARVKLSLGHAMTGARMNPAMQRMIQDSLGGIASGDPQLMAKGLRGAAGIVGSQVNTVQSGFDDATRNAVHERLGNDPMDFYRSINKQESAPKAQGKGVLGFEEWKKANGR